MPHRIQLSRRKGWRMPPNTVKVDRTTKWGNPFVVEVDQGDTPEKVVELYRYSLRATAKRSLGYTGWAQRVLDHLDELRGKNLACWCKPGEPCHADVLLELANRDEPRHCRGDCDSIFDLRGFHTPDCTALAAAGTDSDSAAANETRK